MESNKYQVYNCICSDGWTEKFGKTSIEPYELDNFIDKMNCEQLIYILKNIEITIQTIAEYFKISGEHFQHWFDNPIEDSGYVKLVKHYLIEGMVIEDGEIVSNNKRRKVTSNMKQCHRVLEELDILIEERQLDTLIVIHGRQLKRLAELKRLAPSKDFSDKWNIHVIAIVEYTDKELINIYKNMFNFPWISIITTYLSNQHSISSNVANVLNYAYYQDNIKEIIIVDNYKQYYKYVECISLLTAKGKTIRSFNKGGTLIEYFMLFKPINTFILQEDIEKSLEFALQHLKVTEIKKIIDTKKPICSKEAINIMKRHNASQSLIDTVLKYYI